MDRNARVGSALVVARLLQHVPAADDPLATVECAQARLGPLGPAAAPFDPVRFVAWRRKTGRWATEHAKGRPGKRPELLPTADAATARMVAGIADVPDPAQALAVGALLLRRAGTLRECPSMTNTSARSRRTCAPSRHLAASARSSVAVWSVRVITNAALIRSLHRANRRTRRSNQNRRSEGIWRLL